MNQKIFGQYQRWGMGGRGLEKIARQEIRSEYVGKGGGWPGCWQGAVHRQHWLEYSVLAAMQPPTQI